MSAGHRVASWLNSRATHTFTHTMHHTNRLRNQNVHACHLMQSAMTATAAVCSPLLFGIANIVTDQRYELLPAFKVYR